MTEENKFFIKYWLNTGGCLLYSSIIYKISETTGALVFCNDRIRRDIEIPFEQQVTAILDDPNILWETSGYNIGLGGGDSISPEYDMFFRVLQGSYIRGQLLFVKRENRARLIESSSIGLETYLFNGNAYSLAIPGTTEIIHYVYNSIGGLQYRIPNTMDYLEPSTISQHTSLPDICRDILNLYHIG